MQHSLQHGRKHGLQHGLQHGTKQHDLQHAVCNMICNTVRNMICTTCAAKCPTRYSAWLGLASGSRLEVVVVVVEVVCLNIAVLIRLKVVTKNVTDALTALSQKCSDWLRLAKIVVSVTLIIYEIPLAATA